MKLPTKDDIADFVTSAETPVSKRELTEAFGIKGDARKPFKKLIAELEDEGRIERKGGQKYGAPASLPAVTVIEVTEVTTDGDVFATPTQWDAETQGKPPQIEVKPDKKGHPALTPKDRALARLKKLEPGFYAAAILKRLDTEQARIVGVIAERKGSFFMQPAEKKKRDAYEIPQRDLNGAQAGDMVMAEAQPSKGLRYKQARVMEIIGREDHVQAISRISGYEMGLREDFPATALREAEGLEVPPLHKRQDLRSIPLVTIDGADAKDFDDAVFAEHDTDPKNPGGYHIIVAIADVAYYVRPGSNLDNEAYTRGNSTYFPDRVIPMLPETLSNGLCSLRPDEDRACLAAHLWIDSGGKLLRYKFRRGLMRSRARLIYEQVQAARNGQPDEVTKPLLETVIKPLYSVYNILRAARDNRGALDLDLPEREIVIDDAGNMTGVQQRSRLDAHRLIEEMMILANVAAANALEDKYSACVYRVHDKPDQQKIDDLSEYLKGFDIAMPPGHINRPDQLNAVLDQVREHEYFQLVAQVILRTQSQARYDIENIGHFGLNLDKYAHFTSPIRRYADLLVHRLLVSAHGLGEGGMPDDALGHLSEACEHISTTERISEEAERNATDRFVAQYLAEQVGAQFEGTINGVTRFGLFVTLNETGADGLVPIQRLPDDYYIHDEAQHALVGKKTGRLYRLGAPVTVRLVEAEALSGSILFELVGTFGADIPGFQPGPQTISQDNSGKGVGKSKPGDKHKHNGRKSKGKYGKKNKGKNRAKPGGHGRKKGGGNKKS